MSDVLLAGAGVGAGGGLCVCAGWRRRRFLRFFFFGLTGLSAGRTVEGEMPPVGPWVAVEVEVPGVVPPLLPVGGAPGTTPPVAADALAVPHASATRRTRSANARRNPFAPCMGLGSEPLEQPFSRVHAPWPSSRGRRARVRS